jgi:thiamine pyrophosphokinase
MRSMQKNICHVFGAGEYYNALPTPAPGDYVIAADGGFEHLSSQNIQADLVIGDFDSLAGPPLTANTVVLPQEKDDTDMMAALRAGWGEGYRIFHIHGGTGGRFDHTMANIQCLAYLAHIGAKGFLFDRSTVITVVNNGCICFPAEAKGLLSVFSLTDIASGVTEEGLKYLLNNATLRNIYPVGISNEFIGAPSRISVESGMLIVIYPQDATPILAT